MTRHARTPRRAGPGDILALLEGVRQTGPNRWLARCPAHDDRSPSLSIRDAGDRLLVHCFASCPPGDVLSALGLTLADLFEHDGPTAPHHRPHHRRIPPGDILQALALEAAVAALAVDQLAQGRELDPGDRRRLFLAARRLSDGAEMAARYGRGRYA